MDAVAVQDDYQLNLKFQNSLPNAPSGPFLKNIKITHSFDEFPEYCTSTLEKNYIWQPHFGPDMGVKLDLVDQEAILAQDKGSQLDQADMKYLATNDKSRGKTKQIDDSNKPWWLRNTTYMENNLFNITKVKAKAAEAAQTFSAKRPDLDYNRDMLSTAFINDSFDIVSKTVENLIAKNGANKLVRDMPVVPISTENPHALPFVDRPHSLVRFDEDPVISTRAAGSAEEDYSSSSSSTSASKRRKVDTGLITNLRRTVKSAELRNEVLEVSLVSPLVSPLVTAALDAAGAGGELLYSWVKDYRMDIQHIQGGDSFVFVLPEPATNGAGHSSGAEAVQYFPIRTRVEMKKMNPEDSRPHDCIVVAEE
jgi:hypothetical protein